MNATTHTVWLVRHGETEWSATGRHTGRTDVALSPAGVLEAHELARRIDPRQFVLVATSPLARARETYRLAIGDAVAAHVDPDLAEWDYGVFEALTTAEIRRDKPGWTVWDGPIQGGESIEEVGERADRVIARALAVDGDVLLFSHGHFLRVLAARWTGADARFGRRLALDTASISVLGHERETRVIRAWNRVCASGERAPGT